MIIDRAHNAARNTKIGLALKLYQMVMPFIMRTIMIYVMGIEYVGLNGLFSSVLQVLNLAELGVASAMVYSMYKPIVDDDTEKLCALLNLYKKYYILIGIFIACIGCALTPAIPKIIKSDIPEGINIYILYWLNLFATVMTYWFFAYRSAVFQAYQRIDVISKVVIVSDTFKYIIQIGILYFTRNYYFFVVIMIISQLLQNVLVAIMAKRMYPDIIPKGNLNQCERNDINRRIRDLFTAKFGGVIVGSADTIVISAFLGLTMLAIYQNYFFILSSVIALIEVLYNACLAGIGNSLITENEDKNYSDFEKMSFAIFWVITFCTCCLIGLYQPFMSIWAGDNLMVKNDVVILFAIYFFIFEINRLLTLYKDAGGIWRKDRFRPLVTALSNLVMNIIMVNIWGLYGVILSTIISMVLIGMPWLFNNLFSTIFSVKYRKKYIIFIGKLIVVAICICIVNSLLCSIINGNAFTSLCIRLVVCIIVPNFAQYIIYRKNKYFYDCKHILYRVMRIKNKKEER